MDPFVAEVRIFGFNFAPKGWATCDGQLLPISQNTALFSLLGTQYGGDGKSNFGLPRFDDMAVICQGQGQGLTEYVNGEELGDPFVNLLYSEMPLHTHQLKASFNDASDNSPTGNYFAVGAGIRLYDLASQPSTNLAPQLLEMQGASLPHNNMMPSLTLTYCIALQGVFPARP